jgi:hypothetical protein
MPTVIPNGGPGDITSAEVSAYGPGTFGGTDPRTTFDPTIKGTTTPTTGGQTASEVQIVNQVENKLDVIVSGWIDSGGPGGHQQAAAREILRRAALLQGDLQASVRQWAKPGRDRALLEMFGVLTKALVDRDRLLLELRGRLNDSPY